MSKVESLQEIAIPILANEINCLLEGCFLDENMLNDVEFFKCRRISTHAEISSRLADILRKIPHNLYDKLVGRGYFTLDCLYLELLYLTINGKVKNGKLDLGLFGHADLSIVDNICSKYPLDPASDRFLKDYTRYLHSVFYSWWMGPLNDDILNKIVQMGIVLRPSVLYLSALRSFSDDSLARTYSFKLQEAHLTQRFHYALPQHKVEFFRQGQFSLYRHAAESGYLMLIRRLHDEESISEDCIFEAIRSLNHEAIRRAASNGHADVINYLYEESTFPNDELRDVLFDEFCKICRDRNLESLKKFYNAMRPVDKWHFLWANESMACIYAIANQKIDVLKYLFSLMPDSQKRTVLRDVAGNGNFRSFWNVHWNALRHIFKPLYTEAFHLLGVDEADALFANLDVSHPVQFRNDIVKVVKDELMNDAPKRRSLRM